MHSVPPWSPFHSLAFHVRHEGPVCTGLHLEDDIALRGDIERYSECLLKCP